VRELPLVGSSVPMLRDVLGFLERISREHGDAVCFHIPGQRIFLFNHPDAIEQILVTERDRLIKDELTRRLSLLLGNGLLLSEGAFWRRQRRLAQPGFHRERIAAYADAMVAMTERTIDGWRDGEKREIQEAMMRLTLDIVVKTLFGLELESRDVADEIAAALDVLMVRFSGLDVMVPIWLPTTQNRRTKAAIARLDRVVYGMIAERRRTGDTGDLLSMLIAATDDASEPMTDVQLRDEAMTLILAGHETTALTLSFALDLLARHPDVQENLAREIAAVLGERAATAADLPKLEWADAIVRETLRLYPPAWAVGREATEDIEVAGFSVAKGTQIWAAQWIVHRDARWFPNPDAFEPQRWLVDGRALAKKLPKHAWFPFGGGPRVCIGNAFAMMEAVLVLVTIVRRFAVKRPGGDQRPLRLVPTVTLRPRDGVPLVVDRRSKV
jgi:cytochrome P450